MTMAILPKLRSVGTNLTPGVATLVYTCPPNYTCQMSLLFVANAGSGNKTVSIKWHDVSSNADYFIVGGYVVSAYNFLQLSDGKLVLNAGDYIMVTSEAGSTMDATVTVEEYFDPANRE